jgi:RHS repeat-associated protein
MEVGYTYDAVSHKFTGKERDSESGLDDFGARYFASTQGRFLSPDWAARPTAVPYAVFGDPQSLNLYTYVRNDPVTQADADGHDPDQSNKDAPQPSGCDDGPGSGCKAVVQSSQDAPNSTAAQNNNNQQTQQTQQPKTGGGVLPTGTAAVDLGVGKAGVTVQGSAAAGAFVDNKGHPAVGAEASGSADAYAGQHTAAKPQQDKDSFVLGAFAGVGGGLTFTNAGNAPAMKTMTNTLNIDLGLGPAASISISSGHSGVSSITITFGVGIGAAVTETNTSTVTAPQ